MSKGLLFNMAIHSRHIDNSLNNRIQINFFRADLLWSLEEIIDPYTKKEYQLPIFERTNRIGDRYYKGPNILDLIEKVAIDPKELERYLTSEQDEDQKLNINDEELYIWRIRPGDLLFARPSVIKTTKKRKPTKRDLDSYPLKSLYCTGGRLVNTDELIYDKLEHCKDFTIIEKRSSISVSRQIFLLSTALCDNDPSRACEIAENLARQAWMNDVKRAYKLYSQLREHPSGVPHWQLARNLKASCAVSQEVENRLYRNICQQLGINPDQPLSRSLGRRPKKTKEKA